MHVTATCALEAFHARNMLTTQQKLQGFAKLGTSVDAVHADSPKPKATTTAQAHIQC